MKPQLTAFQQGVLALAKSMAQGIQKTEAYKGGYVLHCQNAQGDFVTGPHGKKYAACALGAAYVNGHAVTKAYESCQGWDSVAAKFPVINEKDSQEVMLGSRIIDLNDNGDMTRPRIVAWLKRVARHAAPPVTWSEVA